MTPENLIFSQQKFSRIRNPRMYFWGFLHDENKILHAHSEFNFANQNYPDNTLYINQLSTLHAHIRGYVADILGPEVTSFYDENPRNVDTIRHCTPRMIEEIIKMSPEYVDYVVIPCAEQRLKELKKHYLDIGEMLLEKDIITNSWYYQHDSIFYQLRK